MKKHFPLRATLTAAALALAAAVAPAQTMKTVAVTAIVDHPALDAVQVGIKEELKAAGYEIGKNLKYQAQSAQGNNSTAAQIARKYVGDGVDVIVPISTPSAQAVAAATKDIAIVYSAVGDPVAAGLVKSWAASGTNITGVSDNVPVDKQIEVIKMASPKARRVGIIYNPGEANSVALVTALKVAFPAAGLTLVEASAPRTVDVSSAAKSLIGKVDMIYAPTDNTVTSAFPGIVKAAEEGKVPVFAGDTAMVKQGAAFALGLNYLDIGRQTGKIVVRILKGEAAGKIASQTSENLDLYVNPKAAKRQGLALSDEMLKAAKVFE